MNATATVADVGERAIIDRIRRRLSSDRPAWVAVDIGDDAAVVEPARNHLEVLTTDALVEGVHFDRRFVDARSIGFRALAVNLSDIAAMGASPRAALLSLGLPPTLPVADLDALVDGFMELAIRYKVTLVGGNVTRSPGPLFIDVTLTGVAKRRKILTRAGGRPGDELFVTGTVGAAAAGLAWLRDHGLPRDVSALAPGLREAVTRFLRPEPRLRFGTIIGRTKAASACMDLSDGLGDAIRQLSQASGTGVRLVVGALPIDPSIFDVFSADPGEGRRAAMSGGDDYELLCAVPRRARRRFLAAAQASGLPVTPIGELTPETGRLVDELGADLPDGFEHFRHESVA